MLAFALTFVVTVVAVLVLLCRISYRQGIIEANRHAVKLGAWVEFVNYAKARIGDDDGAIITVGTQAVVIGELHESILVWIAEPWAKAYDGYREAAFTNLTTVRVSPLLVGGDNRQQTETVNSLPDDLRERLGIR